MKKNIEYQTWVKNDWNIEEARKNSYSLDGMIKRVSAL